MSTWRLLSCKPKCQLNAHFQVDQNVNSVMLCGSSQHIVDNDRQKMVDTLEHKLQHQSCQFHHYNVGCPVAEESLLNNHSVSFISTQGKAKCRNGYIIIPAGQCWLFCNSKISSVMCASLQNRGTQTATSALPVPTWQCWIPSES